MGNKYTVEVWANVGDGFHWEMTWQGEWFVLALYHLVMARRLGHGCTKLSWR